MSLNLEEIKKKKERNPIKLGLSDTKVSEDHCSDVRTREVGGWELGWQSSMLVEESSHRQWLHTPPHVGVWGTRLICIVSACESHAPLPATRLGGCGRWRPVHLLGGQCRPTLSQTVFQKKTFRP